MKKILLIGLPVVVAAIVGLGITGVIPIPGLSPKKVLKNSAAAYSPASEKPPVFAEAPAMTSPKAQPPESPKPQTTAVKKDIEEGAKALATVWNEISAKRLEEMTQDWKDVDLVRVLRYMDNDKVAEFLSQMSDVERASKLSALLQDAAAVAAGGDDSKGL